MKPLRILCINHEYPPVGGGAATVTRELLTRLQKNYQVGLLTGNLPSDSDQDIIPSEFPLFRIKSGRKSNAKGSYREFTQFFIGSLFIMHKIRRQFYPDMILAFFTIPGGLTAMAWKWLFKTDYILSIRGGDIPGFEMSRSLNFFHWLLQPVIRLVCLNATEVHVNSQRLKTLTERLIPAKKVTLIPNGVNFPSLSLPERREESKIKFLFVGRLSKQKNLPSFINGFARLQRDDLQNCTLTIVGDGPEKKVLHTLVCQLGLEDRVSFVGWLSRKMLAEYYLSHKVLVLPSLDEGMSNTALEALAHGCLLLSSERGALDWQDTHIKNFWVVKDSLMPQSWTAILEQIIKHPEALPKDAKTMHRVVFNQYGWDNLMPHYTQLLKSAAG